MSNNLQAFLVYDDTSPSFTWQNFGESDFVVQDIEDRYSSQTPPRFKNTMVSWDDGIPTGPSVEPSNARVVTFSFQGTAAAFFGSWQPRHNTSQVTWRIDGGDDVNLTQTTDLLLDTRAMGQWFTTPTLPDANHTIEFQFPDSRGEIDYAVVTGGQHERYTDQTTIIVDDDTVSEIYYFGTWNKRTVFDIERDRSHNLPFQNATRITDTVGSGFRFQFMGTSLRIYGFTQKGEAGSFEMTHILDGENPRTQNYSVPRVPDDVRAQVGDEQADYVVWFPNWLLAEYTSLGPGEHSITVILNSVNGQSLSFDYLTYTPSFPSLANKPYLPSMPAPSFSMPDNAPAHNGETIRNIIIAGSVLGTLVVATLILGTGFLAWKKRWRGGSPGDEGAMKPLGTIDPFDSRSTVIHTQQTYRKENLDIPSRRVSESSMTQVDYREQLPDNYMNTTIGAPKPPPPVAAGPSHLRSRSMNFMHNNRYSLDTYLPPPTYRSSYG
ncbi:hypothetical protein FA15DRAFT_708875 [Coprinopsis marcescibilis]|uniref:Uncharacterized protein n=1 Tax=Coprinopsis marcescibilis TaxID=230819 RepID=A0A5C3KHH8_COPMA|nr:hypothetical protein FA15DRAFT_708875 [Coprinopsis marcescibilis]